MAGFHRTIGFTLVPDEIGTGVCAVEGRVEERHLNINGVVHGGVYATILDTAMGAAVVTTLEGEEVTATTSLYVDFLLPARLGQSLKAIGTVTRRGRHIAFCDGKILDESDRLMGSGRGTWYIWEGSIRRSVAHQGVALLKARARGR